MRTGILRLLQRSAELLEMHAEEIRAAHTIGGRWPKEDEYGAHRDYAELSEMANRLRNVVKWNER